MPCFINCNLIRADCLGVKLIYSMSDCSFHVYHFILETQVQMLYQVMQVTVSFHSQPLLLLSVFHLGNLKLCRKTNEEWQTPNNLIYSDNIEPTWVKHSFREWPMCRCQLTYIDTRNTMSTLFTCVCQWVHYASHSMARGPAAQVNRGSRQALLIRYGFEIGCLAPCMTGRSGLSCSRYDRLKGPVLCKVE